MRSTLLDRSTCPPDSVSCATICLYDYAVDAGSSSSENIPPLDQRISAALEVIAREGGRIGSHGFAILWRDYWTGTQSLLNITVGVISPFAFYKAIRTSRTIQDEGTQAYASVFDVEVAAARIAIFMRRINNPLELIPWEVVGWDMHDLNLAQPQNRIFLDVAAPHTCPEEADDTVL